MSMNYETVVGLDSQWILGSRAQGVYRLEIAVNIPQGDDDRRRFLYWSANSRDLFFSEPVFTPFYRNVSGRKNEQLLLRDCQEKDLGVMLQKLMEMHELGKVEMPEEASALNHDLFHRMWRIISNVQHRYTPPPLHDGRSTVNLR